MFCSKCGATLPDGAKFCNICGATMDNQTTKGKSKGKGIAIGAAVLAVVLVAAFVVTNLLSGGFGPKGNVVRAASKSITAYAKMMDNFGVSTLQNLAKKQAYTQTIEFEVEKNPADSVLNGLGMSIVSAMDLPGQRASMSGQVKWGSVDLFSLYLDMDKGKVSVFSPEVLKDTALAINTETLGKDLSKADWIEDYTYEDMSAYEDLSFNIFELASLMTKEGVIDPSVFTDLLKEIEVEKDGTDKVKVNGEKIKCTVYDVEIPADALADFAAAIVEAMYDSESTEAIFKILSTIPGYDYDIEDDMKESISDAVAEITDAIELLGDLEFEVAVSRGYIVMISTKIEVYYSSADISLQLGGGKNYVDDLSLTISPEYGDALTIKSSGNHTMKGGEFTDKTVISYDGESITFKTKYDSKAKKDNFSFVMDATEVSNMKFEIEGNLTIGSNSVSMTFDEISLSSYGETLALSGQYILEPVKQVKMPAKQTLTILTMDEDELLDLVWDIQDNIEDWSEKIEDLDIIYALEWLL